MNYDSTVAVHSAMFEGVTFTIARMTFGRRIELMRRVRGMSAKLEFEKAGSQAGDQIQASILSGEIDELYLRWGLVSIAGLMLDGQPADVDSLIASGPEDLSREILKAIKRECSLTEEERKN